MILTHCSDVVLEPCLGLEGLQAKVLWLGLESCIDRIIN